MDLKHLKEVMQLFEKSKLSELRIKDKHGIEIVLKKDEHSAVSKPVAQPMHHPIPSAPHSSPKEQAPPLKEAPTEEVSAEKVIKSPMVGTVYHSSEPGSPVFVKVGDSVKEGDIVCIVEAMKVFNEIKADKNGVVKAIMVDNGEPVEFGQPLLVLE